MHSHLWTLSLGEKGSDDIFYAVFRAKDRKHQSWEFREAKRKMIFFFNTQTGICIKEHFPARGEFALPRRNVARLGDICSCHNWRGAATDIQCTGTKDVAKPAVHRLSLPLRGIVQSKISIMETLL